MFRASGCSQLSSSAHAEVLPCTSVTSLDPGQEQRQHTLRLCTGLEPNDTVQGRPRPVSVEMAQFGQPQVVWNSAS